MSALIPFDSAKLPAHIKPKAKVANAFAALVRNGFKVLSIKSKVFTIVDGETKTLVTKPDDEDTPASNLEVVILAANPSKSRVYYKGGYEEGAASKPNCYSNDNIAPADDAAEPQSKKCATCVHAQYGSKITEAGKKSFACSESMRLCVAPAGQLNDPMLLRVPPTSLKVLGAYGNSLSLRGVEPHQVITKIGFDYTVSHPALTFKATNFVSDEMLAEILETQQTETVGFITGLVAMPPMEDHEEFVPAPKAEAKPKPAHVAEEDDDLPKTPPKTKVIIAEDDEEKPAPKPAAKPKPAPVAVEEDDGLDNLDFDD
jgi:hypothetical protein